MSELINMWGERERGPGQQQQHNSRRNKQNHTEIATTHNLTYLSREMATSVRTLAKTKMGRM